MREDTQQVISEYKINIFGNKKNLERAEALLEPMEKVRFATPTNVIITQVNTRKRDNFLCILFLTDRRLLLSFQALSSFSAESVTLEEICSIDFSGNGITGSQIGVHTLTKSYSIMVTYKKETAQRIYQLFDAAANRDAVPPASVSTAPSPADDLLKYKALLDCGAITQEEFNAKKKQLLNL